MLFTIMKMSNRTKFIIIFSALLTISGIVVLILSSSATISRIYNRIFLANEVHEYSCEELPHIDAVIKVYNEHPDIVQEIRDIKKEQVDIKVDTYTCSNSHGDIKITVGGEEETQKVKKILGKDFFGIPYRIINV